MQLNPFLSVIYLMGKLFKLISQNICKKSSADGLLSWHGNAMEGSQMNCSELKWVQYYIERPQATTHWEASEPSPCPRQPPAASPVFIKFELGLKSVIRCLISGNRTHRIIPVQTTSPLPGDVTKLITTVEDGGEVSPFLPWSGAAWTLMTKDMLHLVRKCWVV